MINNGVESPAKSFPFLPSELEAFVNSLIDTGHFDTSEEVIAEALLQFRDQWELNEIKLSRLKGAIQIGINEAERGELIDGRTAMNRLRAKFETAASHQE